MRRDIFHAIADPAKRPFIHLIAFQTMTPDAIHLRLSFGG